MARTFMEAMEHRRSYYALKNESPISDDEIQAIVEAVVKHAPSAYNMQSTRVVVLFGEQHRKLWNIVKDTLRRMVPPEIFIRSEAKIDKSFLGGYATLMFFEDQEIITALQEKFPSYKDNFPVWSHQGSGIIQFAIWTVLEDAGFAASIQHYNPIIDEQAAKAFDIPENWKLIAQMPFGLPAETPGERTYEPISKRVIVKR